MQDSLTTRKNKALEAIAGDLRAQRARLNLTQLDVAAIADIDQTTVSRIEDGFDTRLSTLSKVAGALGMTVTLTEAA